MLSKLMIPQSSQCLELLLAKLAIEVLTVYLHVIFKKFHACLQLSTLVASVAFFNLIYIVV